MTSVLGKLKDQNEVLEEPETNNCGSHLREEMKWKRWCHQYELGWGPHGAVARVSGGKCYSAGLQTHGHRLLSLLPSSSTFQIPSSADHLTDLVGGWQGWLGNAVFRASTPKSWRQYRSMVSELMDNWSVNSWLASNSQTQLSTLLEVFYNSEDSLLLSDALVCLTKKDPLPTEGETSGPNCELPVSYCHEFLFGLGCNPTWISVTWSQTW